MRPWARVVIFAALVLMTGLGGSSACYAQDVDEDGMPISRPVEQSDPAPDPEAQPQDDPGEAMAPEDSGEASYQAEEEGQSPAEPGRAWFSAQEAGPAEPGEAGYSPDGSAGSDQNPSQLEPGGTRLGSPRSAPPGQSPGAAPEVGGERRPGPFESPATAWAIFLAAFAALAVSLLAAKALMPWPRPRVSCTFDLAPASLPGGALMLYPPDILFSADTICGAPSIVGNLAVQEGSDPDA